MTIPPSTEPEPIGRDGQTGEAAMTGKADQECPPDCFKVIHDWSRNQWILEITRRRDPGGGCAHGRAETNEDVYQDLHKLRVRLMGLTREMDFILIA